MFSLLIRQNTADDNGVVIRFKDKFELQSALKAKVMLGTLAAECAAMIWGFYNTGHKHVAFDYVTVYELTEVADESKPVDESTLIVPS